MIVVCGYKFVKNIYMTVDLKKTSMVLIEILEILLVIVNLT